MRIGFVLYGDLSIRTGGFLYDRMVIGAMKDLGADIELLQLRWRSYASALVQQPHTRVLEWTRAHDFDLLIQDELAHPSLLRANRILHQHTEVPIITIVHHLRCSEDRVRALNWIYREIEKAYLASVDGLIANSEATMASVHELANRPIPSMIAQPGRGHYRSGITEDQIFERSMRKKPFEVLYLGSVIPRKGLHDLVKALSRSGLPDLKLTVIGRDGDSNHYARSVKSTLVASGLESQADWMGEVTDEQVRQALSRAHVLAVPSTHEGFGIAYLDAMGYGVVPIGTTAGGASSMINHGENGFLIDPGDLEALTGCIRLLALNRNQLARMSVEAYRRYLEQPTWEDVATNVYQFLNTHFIENQAHFKAA